jgi:thiamine diphosphokinase
MNKVYLIAGAKTDKNFVKDILEADKDEKKIISVDSGLKILDELNIKPDIILGDFDSVDERVLEKYISRDDIRIERHNPVKNFSDTELAVELCIKLGFKDVFILGGLGARADHSLANIYTCAHYLDCGLNIALIDEYNKIYVKKESFELKKDRQYGKYVSFYPMKSPLRKFCLKGFKYELENRTVDKYETPSLCLSNEIEAETARVDFEGAYILVIESKDRN